MYTEVSHDTQVDFTSSIQLIAALGSQTSFTSIGILVMLWISRSTLFLIIYGFFHVNLNCVSMLAVDYWHPELLVILAELGISD